MPPSSLPYPFEFSGTELIVRESAVSRVTASLEGARDKVSRSRLERLSQDASIWTANVIFEDPKAGFSMTSGRLLSPALLALMPHGARRRWDEKRVEVLSWRQAIDPMRLASGGAARMELVAGTEIRVPAALPSHVLRTLARAIRAIRLEVSGNPGLRNLYFVYPGKVLEDVPQALFVPFSLTEGTEAEWLEPFAAGGIVLTHEIRKEADSETEDTNGSCGVFRRYNALAEEWVEGAIFPVCMKDEPLDESWEAVSQRRERNREIADRLDRYLADEESRQALRRKLNRPERLARPAITDAEVQYVTDWLGETAAREIRSMSLMDIFRRASKDGLFNRPMIPKRTLPKHMSAKTGDAQ